MPRCARAAIRRRLAVDTPAVDGRVRVMASAEVTGHAAKRWRPGIDGRLKAAKCG